MNEVTVLLVVCLIGYYGVLVAAGLEDRDCPAMGLAALPLVVVGLVALWRVWV